MAKKKPFIRFSPSTPIDNPFVAYFDEIDDESGEVLQRKELGRRLMEHDAKNIIASHWHNNRWDDNSSFDSKEIIITQKIDSKPNITYKYHVVDEREQ
jgi:hypothetical protein